MNQKIPAFKVTGLLLFLLLSCVPMVVAAEHIRGESGNFQPVITLAEANQREAAEGAAARYGKEVALEPNRRTYLEKPEV